MNTAAIIDLVRTLIAILSLVFAIWQYLQKRRIKKLLSFEAIELHNNVSVALGATQGAKDAISNGLSPSIEIGRAEGLCQAILYESAKLYCNLKNSKIDDIDDLIDNGQLSPKYKDIYYSFSDKKRGWLRYMMKKISKSF